MAPKTTRVLLLDDDPNLRAVLSDILKVEGIESVPVETGAAALARIEQQDIDVVLIDLKLEDMSGLEVLRGIKTRSPEIECIMLTGHASQATAIKAINLGAYSYFQKPYDVDQLLYAIRRAAEKHTAGYSLRASESNQRMILNNIDEIVYSVEQITPNSPEGIPRFVSDRTEHILGFQPHEFLENPGLWFSLIHPDDIPMVQAQTATISASRQTGKREYRMRHKITGEYRWMEDLVVPRLDEDGNLIGTFGVARDITERKRTEAERQALLEIMQGLVATKNLQGFLQLIHHSIAKVIYAENFFVVFHNKSRGLFEEVYAVDQYDAAMPPSKLGKSITSYVFRTGEPLLLTQARFEELAARGEVELVGTNSPSWLGAPLKTPSETIGVIVVQNYEDADCYSERDREFLASVGVQVSLAIERKQAEEEIRSRLAELESLSQVSDSLTSAIDLQPLLENILAGARNAIPAAEKGTILLTEPDGGLRLQAVSGYTDPRLLGLVLPNQKGYAARVARERIPIKIDDAQTGYEVPFNDKIEEIEAVQSGIAAPLIVKGKVIGVISLDNASRKAAFTESELRLLVTFASSAAVAIENARLFSETQQRLNRLSALHSIDAAIGASVDTKVTLNIVLEHVITELKADAAAVLLFNPLTMMLEYAAGSGFRLHVIEGLRLRLGEGLAGQSVLQRRAIHIADLRQASEVEQLLEPLVSGSASAPLQYLEGENFVAYHAIPLIAKGQVQGVLEIFRRAPMPVDQEWINFFEMLAGQTALAIDNGRLFENLQHSNLELTLAYDATIQGWSQALELRDEETEGHTRRVTELTLRLIQAMDLEEVEKEHARRGALLHDIGKMAIPDSILLKDGPLNEHEWDVMRLHPQYAFNLLSPITYLAPALHIPYCHHEKWDGSGYPRGLKGEEIPEVARIFAIVDVYDALTSNRPYRLAWTREKAMEYIREQSGMHFDPKVVNAFMDLMAGEK